MGKNSKKQFIVFGLGTFGRTVALELQESGHTVMGVDRDELLVQSVSKQLSHAMQLDVRDEYAMREIHAAQFDTAVVALGDLEASLRCIIHCQEVGIGEIVVKAIDDSHIKIAKTLGANRIIFPNRDIGKQLAYQLGSANVLEYIELDESTWLITAKVPPSFVGKNLVELDVRNRYNVNIIAVRIAGAIQYFPDPRRAFQADDQIVVIGAEKDMKGYFGRK